MRNWIDIVAAIWDKALCEGWHNDNEEPIDQEEGCWIKPDGSMEWTDYANDLHHGDIASQYFEIDHTQEWVDEALKAGWIRARWRQNQFYTEFYTDAHVTARAISALRKLASEYEFDRYTIDAGKDVHAETYSVNQLMVTISRLMAT